MRMMREGCNRLRRRKGCSSGWGWGGAQPKQVMMAKVVFSELVQVLRRKVAFPPAGSGWSRGWFSHHLFSYFFSMLIVMCPDQVEKFQVWVFIFIFNI